jgi:hypothetical protein
MRRALSLVWLLAFALAQAAPAVCPMGAQARGAAAAVATMPSHAGHSPAHPGHSRHLPDSHPVPCVASVCVVGVVALAAPLADGTDPGAAPATLAPPSFYRSPVSGAETPPPRTPALT